MYGIFFFFPKEAFLSYNDDGNNIRIKECLQYFCFFFFFFPWILLRDFFLVVLLKLGYRALTCFFFFFSQTTHRMRLRFLSYNLEMTEQKVHSPIRVNHSATIEWHFTSIDFLASWLGCFLLGSLFLALLLAHTERWKMIYTTAKHTRSGTVPHLPDPILEYPNSIYCELSFFFPNIMSIWKTSKSTVKCT